MRRTIPTAGFLILSATVLLLFGFTIVEAWTLHSLGGIIVILVFVGLLIEILQERKKFNVAHPQERLNRRDLFNLLSVFSGALAAYVFSIDLGLGPVIAAALVGILADLLLPSYGVPLYCGAFVGMTSAELFINHGQVAIAGAVAAIIYLLANGTFNGFGGKLGTIAFAGSVITGVGLACEFIVSPPPQWPVIGIIVAYSVIAATLTYFLSCTLNHSAVMASSVVGLVSGLVLPALHPGIGGTLAVMAICASFAGMSSAQRFPHFLQIALAGLVTGVIFIYSTPLMGGAGGKLGTIAFGSVLAVRGYLDILESQITKARP